MKIPPDVPSSVRELAAVLSQPKPMRRGSVSERTMKCGKAGCPCQEDPKARHGPYYSLTRPTAGKTHSRYLSPEQAELAQQQIEQGHLREANRRGFTEAQRPVVLGDGSAWIWTRRQNYSRKPLRFSTAFMLKNISGRWERSFMGTAQKPSPGPRHAPGTL